MNSTANEPSVVAADGVTMVLPTHVLKNFEKADRQLREAYGESPGVESLVRMWLACGTSSIIRKEFELSALNIETGLVHFDEEDEFDGDEL